MGELRLEGRNAVVVGAAGAIGRSVVCDLAAQGARVLAADRDAAGASKAARASGRQALAAVVDVADASSVASLRAEAVSQLGSVDILVNCAAVQSFSLAVDLAVEEWDRVMAVNARGTFLCATEFARHMLGSRAGVIVNVASTSGKVGDAGVSHYSASKFAVIGFTQALAKELAPYGIRANSVCPGTVASEMSSEYASATNTTIEEVAAQFQLLPFPQKPSEISNAILFLILSPSITGQALNVDGGSVFH